MLFDPENKIIQLCAKGMQLEGEGKMSEAKNIFERAWNESSTDFEKFTAAHYVARHQQNVQEKLHWDLVALELALTINDDALKQSYPSLYLNVGKCYEDIGNTSNAKENYLKALEYIDLLPADGYGSMVRKGVAEALKRVE